MPKFIIKKSFNNGMISVIIFIYFSIFSLLMLHITSIYIAQTKHIQYTSSFTNAYAQALSGLRALNALPFETLQIHNAEPSLEDLRNSHEFKLSVLNFYIYKTAEYVYSYSYNELSECVLRARYSIENSIVILSELTYFSRR